MQLIVMMMVMIMIMMMSVLLMMMIIMVLMISILLRMMIIIIIMELMMFIRSYDFDCSIINDDMRLPSFSDSNRSTLVSNKKIGVTLDTVDIYIIIITLYLTRYIL
jgi:hypothetical protein